VAIAVVVDVATLQFSLSDRTDADGVDWQLRWSRALGCGTRALRRVRRM